MVVISRAHGGVGPGAARSATDGVPAASIPLDGAGYLLGVMAEEGLGCDGVDHGVVLGAGRYSLTTQILLISRGPDIGRHYSFRPDRLPISRELTASVPLGSRRAITLGHP